MSSLRVGDPAPDFVAETHTGEQISLAQFRGEKIVVLYFYPRDGTPTCTAEACAFRDAYEHFLAAGAVVIGVSGDSLVRHRGFAAQRRLPFLLVSDADGALRRAFGVTPLFGILPGRVTFVIDRQGIVRHCFSATFAAGQHVSEALEVVRQLVAE